VVDTIPYPKPLEGIHGPLSMKTCPANTYQPLEIKLSSDLTHIDLYTWPPLPCKRDLRSIYHTGWGSGGPLRLTEIFGGQIFNDVYMTDDDYMTNFTPKTPEWLNTGADYL
jgi:hypothetical protein